MRTAARAGRAARHQALFRSVNEEIRAASEAASCDRDTSHDFVCECASETCTTPVRLTLGEYDEVRADARLFVVAPGHEEPQVEQVVRERPHATIVEKLGDRVEAAEETAARTRL